MCNLPNQLYYPPRPTPVVIKGYCLLPVFICTSIQVNVQVWRIIHNTVICEFLAGKTILRKTRRAKFPPILNPQIRLISLFLQNTAKHNVQKTIKFLNIKSNLIFFCKYIIIILEQGNTLQLMLIMSMNINITNIYPALVNKKLL